MPRINFFIDVTEEEMSNFLARMSGGDGRKVTAQADTASDDDGPAATNAPATDKNGVAWDARYHASSKAMNADGTWRARKNMSDAEKAEAEAYNKAGNAPAVTPSLPAEPAASTQSVPAVPSEAPALPAAPAAMPGLPMPAAAPQPVSYEEVVAAYTAAIGKNPSLDVAGLYAKAGVTDPNTLTTDAGAAQRIELKKLFDEAA